MPPLQPVAGNRSLLVDEAYAAIKNAIQSSDLPPGAALVESALAASLEISKTPIREALSRLAQEGLTEAAPFRGYRVTTFTHDDVRSIMELRSVLEGLAARRACFVMSPEALEELAATTSLAQFESSRGNWANVSSAVHRLHVLIHENCGDKRLKSMIDVLSGQFERARLALPVGPNRLVKSVIEHAALLDAIKARDADAAERIMRSHLEALIDTVHTPDSDGDQADQTTHLTPTNVGDAAQTGAVRGC